MTDNPKSVFIKATGGSIIEIEDSYAEAEVLVEKDASSEVVLNDVKHNPPKEQRDD